MRRLLPSTIERNVFRVLGLVAAVAMAILIRGYFNQQDELHAQQIRIESQNARLAVQDARIAAAVQTNCETNRKLISDIALRTVGATYTEYRSNPRAAVEKYRRQLLQIQLYRDNPELLDQVIQRTQQTLADSDPAKCATAIKEAGDGIP